VTDVAADVEAGDQQVMEAFEQGEPITQPVFGTSPSSPLTTVALSKWRKTVSTAFGSLPSPSQIHLRSGRPRSLARLAS
jgi:hypothetical protein